VVEAGLLVSMGDPSSWDTPAATGSELSTISGLREAEGNDNRDEWTHMDDGKCDF